MANTVKLILREKRISGCDSILLTEPLKTYTEDLVPVEVNLSDYEQGRTPCGCVD
jgi:hypothetical protein